MSSLDPDNALGRFLRARRDLVRPEAVGLARHERRRVPGLRREELSLLAGISIDYYVRLERGRDRHPSPLVVDALARALMLDERATAHLHGLAGQTTRRHADEPDVERVRSGVARLITAMADRPAFVLGRHMDVLAANPVAEILHPGFAAGENLMRFIFLDHRARDRYADWPTVATDAVATLRGSAGTDIEAPALTRLVAELTQGSDEFRRLWARHDVRQKTSGLKTFDNPHVGRIALEFEGFAVAASPGQTLVVYSAEPGSAGEQGLRLLATLASNSALGAGGLDVVSPAGRRF